MMKFFIIGMTIEQIIAVAHVASNEKHDDKQLKDLIKIARENGYEADEVIDDSAFQKR